MDQIQFFQIQFGYKSFNGDLVFHAVLQFFLQ